MAARRRDPVPFFAGRVARAAEEVDTVAFRGDLLVGLAALDFVVTAMWGPREERESSAAAARLAPGIEAATGDPVGANASGA